MTPRVLLSTLLLSVSLAAHPMGNFSVNHYARIETGAHGAEVRYVLDLAEIPSFELLQKWNLDAASPRAALEQKASEEARAWIKGLSFRVNGRSVEPHFEKAELVMDTGAGGMPVMRISSRLSLGVAAGDLEYEDHNYAGRAGWKEIVIAAGKGSAITKATAADQERSQALTAYPQDPTIAPPQDLQAKLTWAIDSPAIARKQTPEIVPAQAPAATAPVPPGQDAPGTVVRGDFLSQLLHRGEISGGMILIGMCVAFGLGALHALSPGHGKTIVAAYLVGNRGTIKHAIFLGAMVTFTHTFSVFCLGLATLYLYRDVLPDNVIRVLGAISGMSIVWIGAMLLFKRARALRAHGHEHTHDHDHHHHDHDHNHDHDHHHRTGRPFACARGRNHDGQPDRIGRERRSGALPFRAGAAAERDRTGTRGAWINTVGGLQSGTSGGLDGNRHAGAVRQEPAAGQQPDVAECGVPRDSGVVGGGDRVPGSADDRRIPGRHTSQPFHWLTAVPRVPTCREFNLVRRTASTRSTRH